MHNMNEVISNDQMRNEQLSISMHFNIGVLSAPSISLLFVYLLVCLFVCLLFQNNAPIQRSQLLLENTPFSSMK